MPEFLKSVSLRIVVLMGCFSQALPAAAEFDHQAWDELLRAHVVVKEEGVASAVDYQAMTASLPQLRTYLAAVEAVPRSTFESWAQDEQLALLINLYNAATVELIVENLGEIDSIRDIGSFFTLAWDLERVGLFGERVTLDRIEHDMIRGWGRYDEPRIHFAVNCAAVGCPALRPEAYTGALLDAQLEDATRLFLSDRSRNRFEGGRLRLSSIFKWYREDFESGWGGSNSLAEFTAGYAEQLGLTSQQAQDLRAGRLGIRFLSYDWGLNSL